MTCHKVSSNQVPAFSVPASMKTEFAESVGFSLVLSEYAEQAAMEQPADLGLETAKTLQPELVMNLAMAPVYFLVKLA